MMFRRKTEVWFRNVAYGNGTRSTRLKKKWYFLVMFVSVWLINLSSSHVAIIFIAINESKVWCVKFIHF